MGKARRVLLVLGSALLAVLCLGGALVWFWIGAGSNDRGSFSQIDIENQPEFLPEYTSAREQNAPWLRSSREVALEFVLFGDKNSRGVEVHTLSESAGKAVTLVTDSFIEDDSIAAERYRIELAQKGDIWEVEWAGWQHQCRRDQWYERFLGKWGWHTRLCV